MATNWSLKGASRRVYLNGRWTASESLPEPDAKCILGRFGSGWEIVLIEAYDILLCFEAKSIVKQLRRILARKTWRVEEKYHGRIGGRDVQGYVSMRVCFDQKIKHVPTDDELKRLEGE
jgi:hypothetical protein